MPRFQSSESVPMKAYLWQRPYHLQHICLSGKIALVTTGTLVIFGMSSYLLCTWAYRGAPYPPDDATLFPHSKQVWNVASPTRDVLWARVSWNWVSWNVFWIGNCASWGLWKVARVTDKVQLEYLANLGSETSLAASQDFLLEQREGN